MEGVLYKWCYGLEILLNMVHQHLYDLINAEKVDFLTMAIHK